MVSRATSGTGSGGHSQPVFSTTEGKSFLMVLGVGRWSGLLPEEVSCRPRKCSGIHPIGRKSKCWLAFIGHLL